MDFLQSLLDNSTFPVITVFILGILTAISPCPLATNITAIGFISKDIENHHRIFIGNYIPVYTSLSIIITNSHKLIGIEFVRNKERR